MTRSIPATTSAIFVAMLAAGAALADTLRVPGEFPTIQAAIDAAVDDDTVLVADGVYSGAGNRDMTFAGKAIIVRSESGPAACIIDIQADAAGPHRAFHFHSGESAASVVEGFTIRNGYMARGGAVLCEGGASPTFRECVFRDNTAWTIAPEDGGGAVYNLGSSPAFIDCDFVRNHVESNAQWAGGGAMRNQAGSSPTLTGCRFLQNTAAGSGPATSGAMANNINSHPQLTDCRFIENESSDWDGAVGSWEDSGATMHNCEFRENLAANGNGGAYSHFDGGSASFVDCRMIGNVAALGGAGVFLQNPFDGDPSGHITFTRCEFTDNTSSGPWGGAGVRVSWASAEFVDCDFKRNTSAVQVGGAVLITDEAQATFTNTTFEGNHSGGGGGAFGVVTEVDLTLSECKFVNNTSGGDGGALIFVRAGRGSLTNCLFVGNEASRSGAALWVGDVDSWLDMTNCTLTSNRALSGGGIRIHTGGGASITNSILWGNAPDQISEFLIGAADVTFSNVQGGWNGAGNIDADPLFADPGAGDFSLGSFSPCIDAADNTAVPAGVLTDLAGNPRFHDDPWIDDTGVAGGAGGVAIVDMGAYELQGSSCRADLDGDRQLSVVDFFLFLDLFAAADPRADINGDGRIDVDDFFAFLDLFELGC